VDRGARKGTNDVASTIEYDAERSVQNLELPTGADEDFDRGLKERHIQMIAIGGAIGVGLFLGSAKAIQQAGPSLLLSYAVAGLVIFFIMRALGELLMYRPVAGSYATYADEFVGPWAGFTTAWTYWLMWVVIGMAEITAAGKPICDAELRFKTMPFPHGLEAPMRERARQIGLFADAV